MKKIKVMLVLLCAVAVILSSCGKLDFRPTAPPVIENKYPYSFVCLTDHNVKVKVFTDSVSYRFVTYNLCPEDKIFVTIENDKYVYESNRFGDDHTRVVTYFGADSTSICLPSSKPPM